MANNRLLVFARKPAPVQVTYLAYCSTTGLPAIDYRLTDPFLDPPGQAGGVLRRGVGVAPRDLLVLPAPHRGGAGRAAAGPGGRPRDLRLPEQLLQGHAARPGRLARLAAGGAGLAPAAARPPRRRTATGCGSSSPRAASIRDGSSSWAIAPLAEYFRLYDRIDIGLDPFPYAGGTTTCDALWMGVPVVSLAGQTAVGRAGLSILSNVGLPELVARTPEEYVRIAAGLAGDLPRLADLRAGLRDRLQRSPLTDARASPEHVEAAFRAMWRRWVRPGAVPIISFTDRFGPVTLPRRARPFSNSLW